MDTRDGHDAVVAMLREVQAALDLSDGAFAARLGISRTYWQGIRTGRNRMGLHAMQRAGQAFPSLTKKISAALFLTTDVDVSSDSADSATKVPA